MLSDVDLNTSPYRYEYRFFSESGPRYKNEDTIGVVEIPDCDDAIFVVCDGMGGHRNGDVASQTVVKALDNFWRSNSKHLLCKKKILDAADEAMVALNKKAYRGMGTTMAMIAIHRNKFFTAHCGDSRIYYSFRRPELYRVFTGHLRVHIAKTPEGWEYVSKDFIQLESKHIPEIHDFKIRFKPGDRFLICSDGVYNAFKSNEIEQLLQLPISIDELTGMLHEQCDKAAPDNYSAIVLEII